MVKRREFLSLALSASALAPSIAAGAEPVAIGLLSDIHVGDEKQAEVFRKALAFIAKRNPDAVVIAGDMANNGFVWQYELVAAAWEKVFPGDRGPDGRKVAKVFVNGNHDVEGHTYLAVKTPEERALNEDKAIGPRRAEAWEKCFHEKWEPIRIREVKGWKFVCTDFGFETEKNLSEFFAKHHAELASQPAFFYVQHKHPFNTCFGLTVPQSSHLLRKIFDRYPNMIAISGHSHMSIHDERAIWQGTFTSIGLSTLAAPVLFGGRENTTRSRLIKTDDEQMPAVYTRPDGKQGMFMWLYPDRAVVRRDEYVYGETLGPDWTWRFDSMPDSHPYAFETRAKNGIVPAFGSKAKVEVTVGKGKNRRREEVDQLFVSFPNVLARDCGTRANDFEIQLETKDTDVFKIECTKRVYSRYRYLGESRDTKPVVCAFAISETPSKRLFRFVVRPCDAFGNFGKPLYSDWFGRSAEVVKYNRYAKLIKEKSGA